MLFDLKLSLAITAIKALQVYSMSGEKKPGKDDFYNGISSSGRSFRSHFVRNTKDGKKIRLHWGYEVGGRHLV